MEAYKFRLQKLLDIRKEKEEESKRIFRQAQHEKEKTEAKLLLLKEDFRRYREGSDPESIAMKKMKNIFLNSLSSSIADTQKELQNNIIVLDEKREHLKQRQIERKTVEILKEKQYQAYLKEQQLMEQKVNDEFALYGFLRTSERR